MSLLGRAAVPPQSLDPADCSGRSSARPAWRRPARASSCSRCSWARSSPRRSRGRPTTPGTRSAPTSPSCSRSDRTLVVGASQSSGHIAQPGYRVGIVGSLWLLGLVAVIGDPGRDRRGRLPRGVLAAGPAAADHPDQHRQPGRRAVDRLRHPRPGPVRPGLRHQGPGAGPDAAGRRA